jgi:tetratricopeptide (TPR) repeat protein
MSKHTLIAGLTLLSVIFVTAHNACAEIAPSVRSLTIRRMDTPTTTTERGNNDRQAYKESEESLKYTRLGWEAQQQGEKETALAYYTKAVEADDHNAYAFMAAGNLLGKTKEGIICMKAAVVLFKEQGNQEGYTASLSWLEVHNIDTSEVK